MKKKFRFNAKYVDNDKLTTGGRKKDSNYYRRQISKKKNFLYFSFAHQPRAVSDSEFNAAA